VLSENPEVRVEQSLASAYMLWLVKAYWLHIFGLEPRDLEGGEVCHY